MPIYNIDWNKWAILLLPPSLRKRVRAIYIISLLEPVKFLYDWFLNMRTSLLKEASMTGQVIKLEAMLNDVFDATHRRIYITDGEYFVPPIFFEEYKNKPVIYYQEGDLNNPIYYSSSMVGDAVIYNFYVHVPSEIYSDYARIRALVVKYKIFGRTFEIITI